jgi:hypothetical membrane protein
MKSMTSIKSFTDRYPFVGPAFWIVSLQFYITQFVVALAWASPYSFFQNTISDLGNTNCGMYSGRYVCSPLHSYMNTSFVVLGITMIVGGLLIYQEFQKTAESLIGFSAMMLAGFGTLLVGLYPENSIGPVHQLGALLPFLIGNAGMVILGQRLDIPRWLRYYTTTSGSISLLALVFFSFHVYIGIGIGGMERIVAHPQTIWLIVFGAYISSNHIRSAKTKKS